MTYVLSAAEDAKQSIKEQVDWYKQSEDRKELGEEWLKRFRNALETLKANPLKFGFAPENGQWRVEDEIRQYLFRPWKSKSTWRVLYSVDQKAGTVTLVQVRHSSRPLLSDSTDV